MPGPRRKGVAREGFEGMAHQCGSGARLGPFEGSIWLWLYHFSMANILGLGLDATDIDRITATISRYGDRFVTRIFTTNEIAYCARRHTPAIHFAGRFAAKEAAMKALGTGHSRGVLWRDIEVARHGDTVAVCRCRTSRSGSTAARRTSSFTAVQVGASMRWVVGRRCSQLLTRMI